MQNSHRVRAALIASALLIGCQSPQVATPAVKASSLVAQAPCQPVEAYGAIADDGLDDRAAVQAALNAGCLRLGAGQYDVFTPPLPRQYWVLSMPDGARIEGLGDRSQLVFSGDPLGRDWRGIQLGDNPSIDHVALLVRNMTGATSEQTHVLRIDGPRNGIRISHVLIDHPVVAGSKRGDCIQFVGYPPSATSPDKRITDVTVDHVTFAHCARSGIAVHSGLHNFRFADNVFLGTSDQDLDFEGSGDITDGEIADNDFEVPQYFESALAVQIAAADRIHFHHNWLNGRSLDLYGCNDCEIDHNRITQSVPGTTPVVNLRKASHDVRFHDERWERLEAAGVAQVANVSQKLGAPDSVCITDSKLIQHAGFSVLQIVGIVGFRLTDSMVTYDSIVTGMVGVLITGSAGDGGLRSTDLHVLDSTFIGPLRWIVSITGSYLGVGSLEVRRVTAPQALGGLTCSNLLSQGTITGPVSYADSTLPLQSGCTPLMAP